MLIIVWVGAFFYLGNQLTFDILKQTLFISFLRRFLGNFLFGIICQLPILVLNIIYNYTRWGRADKIEIRKLFIILTICTIISSLIGTFIFFSN